MSGAILPTLPADIAAGKLDSLHALLSGRQTRDTSLLDAILDYTEKQDTLLTWAARHGQVEVVRLLLAGGASARAADGGGASALYIACQEGHLEIATLLRDAGAAVDHSGK